MEVGMGIFYATQLKGIVADLLVQWIIIKVAKIIDRTDI